MRPARQRPRSRGMGRRGRACGLIVAGSWGMVGVVGVLGAPATTAVSEAAAANQSLPASSGMTTTPVLSVRRLPGWVAQTVAAGRLQTALAGILASPTLGAAARTSCLVASQGGRVLYAYNPLQPLIPASNEKLLTSTAVLERLGAADRLTTSVRAARPAGGVVSGNLYLVGGGDPLLRTPGYVAALGPDRTLYTSLHQLAAQVRAAGVLEVTGCGRRGRQPL